MAGGANDIAVAPVDTLSCVLPIEATERQLSWSFGSELSSLTAPIRAGQTVSTLQVWFEGICVAQTDLVAMNQSDIYVPVTEPSLKDDPAEAEDNFGKIVGAVLIVVLIIAALAVVLLLIGRIMRFVAKKAQARRRRRSRRRNRNA